MQLHHCTHVNSDTQRINTNSNVATYTLNNYTLSNFNYLINISV